MVLKHIQRDLIKISSSSLSPPPCPFAWNQEAKSFQSEPQFSCRLFLFKHSRSCAMVTSWRPSGAGSTHTPWVGSTNTDRYHHWDLYGSIVSLSHTLKVTADRGGSIHLQCLFEIIHTKELFYLHMLVWYITAAFLVLVWGHFFWFWMESAVFVADSLPAWWRGELSLCKTFSSIQRYSQEESEA